MKTIDIIDKLTCEYIDIVNGKNVIPTIDYPDLTKWVSFMMKDIAKEDIKKLVYAGRDGNHNFTHNEQKISIEIHLPFEILCDIEEIENFVNCHIRYDGNVFLSFSRMKIYKFYRLDNPIIDYNKSYTDIKNCIDFVIFLIDNNYLKNIIYKIIDIP